jgi:hypothetical protein
MDSKECTMSSKDATAIRETIVHIGDRIKDVIAAGAARLSIAKDSSATPLSLLLAHERGMLVVLLRELADVRSHRK